MQRFAGVEGIEIHWNRWIHARSWPWLCFPLAVCHCYFCASFIFIVLSL